MELILRRRFAQQVPTHSRVMEALMGAWRGGGQHPEDFCMLGHDKGLGYAFSAAVISSRHNEADNIHACMVRENLPFIDGRCLGDALVTTAKEGNEAQFRKFLEQPLLDAIGVNGPKGFGAALIQSVAAGNNDVARLILNDPISNRLPLGEEGLYAALHVAVERGQLDLVDSFLLHPMGGDIIFAFTGVTVLISCGVCNNHLNVVRRILRDPGLEEYKRDGMTCALVDQVVQKEALNVLRPVLDSPISRFLTLTELSFTLDKAANIGNLEVLTILITFMSKWKEEILFNINFGRYVLGLAKAERRALLDHLFDHPLANEVELAQEVAYRVIWLRRAVRGGDQEVREYLQQIPWAREIL